MFDNNINNDENKIDFEFFEESKKVLIGMTEKTIKNNFSLDSIKAATCSFNE